MTMSRQLDMEHRDPSPTDAYKPPSYTPTLLPVSTFCGRVNVQVTESDAVILSTYLNNTLHQLLGAMSKSSSGCMHLLQCVASVCCSIHRSRTTTLIALPLVFARLT